MKINTTCKSIITQLKDNIFKNKILKKKYSTHFSNTKYSLNQILEDIVYLLKTGVSYRNLRSSISWNTIYKHKQLLEYYDIFKKTYYSLIKEYLKNKKLSVFSTDTSIIGNVCGVHELDKNKLRRNKYFKNKFCFKLSGICDEVGVPLHILVENGNTHDSVIFFKHKTFLDKHKNKQITLLADKGYDSSKIRNYLKSNNYSTIIPYNKRNTKDVNKIKELNDIEKNMFKSRIEIEHVWCKLKKNKRIFVMNEKNIKSYKSFLYMALVKYTIELMKKL